MNGDVILLRCTSEGERMVLPERDFRTAEEDVLACTGLGVLFLDLDLTNVAGMLHDFGDVCLVLAADFTGNTLGQVNEATVHPVLPEDTYGRRADRDAEGGEVRLDHAERSMDRPENEEDNEEVMSVPEALKVGASRLFERGEYHSHERGEHHVT